MLGTKTKPKPIIKWVGGKTQLLRELSKLKPTSYVKYIEPFFGGGALFFALAYKDKKAIINDFNPTLTDLYKDIRDNIDELIQELRGIEEHYLSSDVHETRRDYYIEYRDIFNNMESSVYKSAIFIFLNRVCFNGVYRVNPKGEFNVPFGRNNIRAIFDEDLLRLASSALSNAQILCGSYEHVYHLAQKGDFVYLDPPYVPLSATANFTSYTSQGFGSDEHIKLRDFFIRLNNKGCLVMLSNSNTEKVRELYKNFKLHEVQASRAVNCKANGRGKITELVIKNY